VRNDENDVPNDVCYAIYCIIFRFPFPAILLLSSCFFHLINESLSEIPFVTGHEAINGCVDSGFTYAVVLVIMFTEHQFY
jgi:hypothetical protein